MTIASPRRISSGAKERCEKPFRPATEPEGIARDYPLRITDSQRFPAFLTLPIARASIDFCPSEQNGLWNLLHHYRTSQDATECAASPLGRAHGQFWRLGHARRVS